jgi:mxaL protein
MSSWRLVLLLIAMGLTIALFFHPTLTIPRNVFRYLFVIDITQSMNARDYRLSGYPSDRLEMAKASIRDSLHALPCGSEVGIGLFTTQSVNFLLEPIEICRHFSVIDDVLKHIDWRMAWSADSHVEVGLYQAIREIYKKDPSTRLVFMTDGQETPPQTVKAQFDGTPRALKGLIVGVGGRTPATVPRYDRDMNSLGIWENADIEKPPISSNVYTEKVEVRTLPTEGPYLSWMDETHLKALAATTGLGFLSLDTPELLTQALLNDDLAELRPALTDLRGGLGLLVLAILLLAYGVDKRVRHESKSRTSMP